MGKRKPKPNPPAAAEPEARSGQDEYGKPLSDVTTDVVRPPR